MRKKEKERTHTYKEREREREREKERKGKNEQPREMEGGRQSLINSFLPGENWQKESCKKQCGKLLLPYHKYLSLSDYKSIVLLGHL